MYPDKEQPTAGPVLVPKFYQGNKDYLLFYTWLEISTFKSNCWVNMDLLTELQNAELREAFDEFDKVLSTYFLHIVMETVFPRVIPFIFYILCIIIFVHVKNT